MQKKIDLGTVITAMVTPFMNDSWLDFKSIHNVVNHLIETGTDTILVAGSTGEASQLTEDEKWAVIDQVKRSLPKNTTTKMMVAVADQNTMHAIEKTKRAFELGADAVLVTVPPYIKPSQEALFLYFNSIAKAIDGKPRIFLHMR